MARARGRARTRARARARASPYSYASSFSTPADACVNDCTLKNIAPVCGSDGNWYINNCARRKINCNLTKNIVKESDDSFCTGG